MNKKLFNSAFLLNNRNLVQVLKKTSNKFGYIKTYHSFHLVDPSPWPVIAAFSSLMVTSGLVLYMNKYLGGLSLIYTGVLLIFFIMYLLMERRYIYFFGVNH